MVRVRYDRCNGPLEILGEEPEALFESDDVYPPADILALKPPRARPVATCGFT